MSDYSEFLATRPLSWWREYMNGAFQIYAKLVKRPITPHEKHRLFNRLRRNKHDNGIGSYTALAIMEHAFPQP